MLKIIKQSFPKFLIGLTFAVSALSASAQLSDRVIAVVDEDVILQSEFDARVEQIIANNSGRNLPPRAELREGVLDQLIIESLQLQLAERSGIRIDDNRLNQALTQIAAQNNMSFEQFRNVLNQDGQYLEFREQIRRDLMINNLQTGTINQRITITRQEIANYLRSEAAQTDIAPEFRVHHILIPVENPLQNQLQEELADLLYQQIQDGASILDLAASQQILGIPVSGGDLAGWRKTENLPTMFRPVVPTLDVGEVSEPFTSDSGFHIVEVVEKRGGVDLQVNQSHVRHIMLRPNEIRTPQQTRELIFELHERIRGGEDFGDLARVYTDDPTSMVSGGDLDWVTEGQLPPPFEAALSEVPVGEMSEPFQVGQDWHIAEVLERRVEDVTEENRRFQAEQILRERKFETELQNWLSEIRDTAYIDIKIDEDS
ncbi:MAG: molecular chaperone SurA [Gammaproteobacteria bacterium]|nr:molecular chaperone SurA [Gammaproteobacteria bacterium]MAY02854.1 molecular chaperone SurA [Gammaproteobacteria bacterium]|tara:strand:+ start:297 stop:1586 length:1290 start_codon:yes stop_codon:yes gene_type:complete